MFVGFNSDGDSDFSIVAMTDLSINTNIYFTDSEPNASGDGNLNSEGVLKWVTGDDVIETGTVIVFSDVDSSSNTNFSSSIGVLTVVDAGFNISSDGDAIYATYGDPSMNSVSRWISGIQNNDNGLDLNFSSTSLSVLSNYVVIDNTVSKDGGVYSGVKEDKTIEEFKSLIVNEEHWTTHTTEGESFIPFNTDSFNFSIFLSTKDIRISEIILSIESGKISVSNGSVVKVFNVLGQEINNEGLSSGVYFVFVEIDKRIQKYKIAI